MPKQTIDLVSKNTIKFDKQELANLKRAYTIAVDAKKTQFVFKGNDLLVSYAKYLIEHLTNSFSLK